MKKRFPLIRYFSRPVSAILVKFPITPNQITTASLLLGVSGSIFFISPSFEFRIIGSLIFFLSYIFSFSSAFLILSYFLHLKILIFAILIACVASDIGGFVVGKIFKGKKLTKLSPNKTISGAIGSLIFSISFLSLAIYYLTKNFEIYFLVIGFLTSIACQAGDLFFSFLKRKSLIKDTGSFLPGHGGILDRVDGILLGMPVGFLALLMLY